MAIGNGVFCHTTALQNRSTEIVVGKMMTIVGVCVNEKGAAQAANDGLNELNSSFPVL